MKFTTLAEAEAALTAAVTCFEQTRKLSSAERHAILTAISAGLQDQREAFAQLLCAEAKKPIRDARVEVDRAALTFSLAADEARRFGGEILPLDLSAAAVGRMGLVRRFPLGPIAAVTPFNFPLNLVAHKVAPAIAVGAPVVLKPAEKTPQIALKLQELVHACGWPEAAFAVLTPETPQEVGHLLADDPRLPVFSFTGSDTVGWALKQRAHKKRVILELGGNAAVLVDHASKVEHAVARCVVGGFAYSGQVCISVQRIFVVENYFEAFCAELVARVRALKLGDPTDETTDLGPMITEDAAIRVEQWVEQAKAAGARVLLQGPRDGALQIEFGIRQIGFRLGDLGFGIGDFVELPGAGAGGKLLLGLRLGGLSGHDDTFQIRHIGLHLFEVGPAAGSRLCQSGKLVHPLHRQGEPGLDGRFLRGRDTDLIHQATFAGLGGDEGHLRPLQLGLRRLERP